MRGQNKNSVAMRARGAEDMSGAQTELSGLFDSDDYGYAGEMSPAWGALIGAGLAEGGILIGKAMRRTHPRMAKYAGVVGLLAGGVPAGVAIIFPSTRRAGLLGLAVTAIASVGEFIRANYVEPQLGFYQPEMTGAGGIEILGDEEADYMAEAMIANALGAGGMPIEVMGQPSAQSALAGLGLYQPEMTGARPMDVMGVSPYSGSF
jgi:hypothetical protein